MSTQMGPAGEAQSVSLMVFRDGHDPQTFPLEQGGLLLGRGEQADVILEDDYVSRRHARLFRDPFGRWILEDLDSRNGVQVNSAPIRSAAVGPRDEIVIGPFRLKICDASRIDLASQQIRSFSTVVSLEESETRNLVAQGNRPTEELTRARIQELNTIADRFVSQNSPAELYPEICRAVAAVPGSLALILRLPSSEISTETHPEVIACQSRSLGEDNKADVPTNVHMSRTVLNAARSRWEAVAATSAPTRDDSLALTIVDTASPRRVFCGPICDAGTSEELLYLDLPAEQCPFDMLDFFSAVVRQANLARKGLMLAEVSARRRVLDHQLEMARKIQLGLTPGLSRPVPGLDLFIHYCPAMWVGGDYCDVWETDSGRLAIALGDVSGKGLPAAMIMANLQGLLRTAVTFCGRPDDALRHVNRHLCDRTPDDSFVTLFFGLLDPATGHLDYVNAGHMAPLLLADQGQLSTLAAGQSPPLGILTEEMVAHEVTIQPGEALIAFSDGVTEAMNPQGKLFGDEGVRRCLKSLIAQNAEQIGNALLEQLQAHCQSAPSQDDVTLLAMIRSS